MRLAASAKSARTEYRLVSEMQHHLALHSHRQCQLVLVSALTKSELQGENNDNII